MISIITPLFNRAQLVRETWDSIKNQTCPDWEWIVVDDGSTDGGDLFISSLAETDNRVKLYYRKDGNKGPSRCRNIGAQIAQGDFLLFLDSDDLLTKNCIEARLQPISGDPSLDFVVFPQKTFRKIPGDNDGQFGGTFDSSDKYLLSFLQDNPPWCISGPVWKKSSFMELGGFNEAYSMMEDPELHICALLRNMNFVVMRGEADFFYRLPQKSDEESRRFWSASILGRIKFYEDLYNGHLKGQSTYKKALTLGIRNFYKGFFLYRSQLFKNEFIDFSRWARKAGLLSSWKYILIRSYHTFNGFPFNRIPLIKGIIYKVI
jgi:glycosyltransferase involved in cell wall biosynthesis